MLSFATIVPHPPIIIPTIGKREDLKRVRRTVEAMKRLREDFEKSKTETLIVISPHAPISFHELTIFANENLSGDFLMFGDFKTSLSFENDIGLTKKIAAKCKKEKISYRLLDEEELDHGILVPLFYLTKKIKPKIMPLAYSMLEAKTNFKYGEILGKIIKESKKRIGIVASGDLSHRLTQEAPAGFSPKGKEFDEKLVDLLEKGETEKILNIDKNLIEEAGECGYRSIAILLGALSEFRISNLEFRILNYERPFGVGYLVANIEGVTRAHR